MTYVNSYIKNGKKRNIFTILGITLSSVLLISVGVLFSSLREYLINNVKEEIGNYHVIIKGDIKNYDFISSKQNKNERYYIIYKNINKVYENTKTICKKDKCKIVTYNDSLLSLYGMSKSKNILKAFKKIIYFLVSILSIIIFFIIYNSFNASLTIRKKDVASFKLIGMDNNDLYKLFFKEALIIGLTGIILGFILSIFTNWIILKIINVTLYEIFKGKLILKVYFPFIFIPFLFMTLIILISASLPLKNIKKYKAMELFRKKDVIDKVEVKPFKNFILWLTCINYKRSSGKYKNLIVCVFIFVISINIFSLILKYGLECMNRYVIVPEYDLNISLKGNYEKLSTISKDLKASKKIIFKSCEAHANMPKKYFLNDYNDDIKVIVTNIGGNEIINKVDKITQSNSKISHVSYNRFHNLDEITFEGKIKISNLSLSNNIPYFFKGVDDVIINLNKDDFNKICDEYIGNLYLNTNYKGLDEYIDKLIKENKYDMTYQNVKKSKEIINNLTLIIEFFLHALLILIFMVMTSSVINTVFININYRKRELSTFQSIGLERNSINLSLLLESLIISLKGWLYAVPSIFIINKYIYNGIKEMFDFNKIILNLNVLFLSLIIAFLTVFIVMLISHKSLGKNSLISNIKSEF